jgi:hypothetical protein
MFRCARWPTESLPEVPRPGTAFPRSGDKVLSLGSRCRCAHARSRQSAPHGDISCLHGAIPLPRHRLASPDRTPEHQCPELHRASGKPLPRRGPAPLPICCVGHASCGRCQEESRARRQPPVCASSSRVFGSFEPQLEASPCTRWLALRRQDESNSSSSGHGPAFSFPLTRLPDCLPRPIRARAGGNARSSTVGEVDRVGATVQEGDCVAAVRWVLGQKVAIAVAWDHRRPTQSIVVARPYAKNQCSRHARRPLSGNRGRLDVSSCARSRGKSMRPASQCRSAK